MSLSHSHPIQHGIYDTGERASYVLIRVGDRVYTANDGETVNITNAFNVNTDIPIDGTKFKQITIESLSNTRVCGSIFVKTFEAY